jgi:exopolysaccharide biosynthesis polyprenyl glycosylphosphotransferase
LKTVITTPLEASELTDMSADPGPQTYGAAAPAIYLAASSPPRSPARLETLRRSSQWGVGPSLPLALLLGWAGVLGAISLTGPVEVWPNLLAQGLAVRDLLLLGGAAMITVRTEEWLRVAGRRGRRQELERAARVLFIAGAACLTVVLALSGAWQFATGSAWGGVWLASLTATLGLYYTPRIATQRLAATRPRRVIIVGSGSRAVNLARRIWSPSNGTAHELLGFVDSNPVPAHPWVERNKLGRLEDLERILMAEVVDEVLIALPIKSQYSQIQRVIGICEDAGTESKYLADIFDCSVARPRYEIDEGLSVVSLKVTIDGRAARLKRAIDIVGATVALLLAAPLMLLIALAIKLSSEGPVFFLQERFGQNKRRFRMYKFRTMVAGAETMQASLEPLNESGGPVFKIRNDPRVTPLGRLLRRTSLDELPQLVNVLRGEMSLVGPRPLPTRDVLRFQEARLMRRFSVRPGITGMWQVSGRSEVPFEDWIRMDLRYIDRWSLGLDLEIMARTIPAVLTGRGAQ